MFVYLACGFDANKRLSKGHRPEATVEEKEADIGVDMQEGGHIQIVGQGGWQPQDPDHTLGGLHLTIRQQHSVNDVHYTPPLRDKIVGL